MNINIYQTNQTFIAEVISDEVLINEVQDALELMVNCGYQGAKKIIIHEKNIITDFFDLKTRIAGDILQKFSNYDVQLAIVGDFLNISSKSLKDFIYESNRIGRISFVSSIDEAKAKLAVH
ncbi:MAG: DUF4180 domain-containing protein [Bacteroidales bacterium]|nr:MAG: DUF4180 domain-containing protein [Bacteroidales bacterium]